MHSSTYCSRIALNYHSFLKESDELLDLLSTNQGRFPEHDPNIPGRLPHSMSPETPYESRYFTVLVSANGNILQTDTSKTVSVTEEEATEHAKTALQKNASRGFTRQFRYSKTSDELGTRIIFLDCGRKLDALYGFALSSALMSLLGYMVIFVVVIFVSGKIIRPVAQSYEKQKRFITDAGHEIKTPLAIINANVDLAEMEQEGNEYIFEIKQQTKRLTELTESLVYLARMEESDNALAMIEFPISDVIAETASSFKALAQLESKQFSYKIQPMLSIKGNEATIRQLVSILLDNALKYSQDGGTVSLSLSKQGRYICLSVFNTTPHGISQQDTERMFDRFYRLDKSRNSQTGGYGIGLSIAKAIVDSHAGKIQASSRDTHSLTLNVYLPT